MRITIIPSDGVVGVDGVFRQVSMAGIDPAIHAIQFDTTKGAGEIEYRADATVEADVRDEAAERTALAAADTQEKLDALAPVTKTVAVRRGNEPLADFAAFQVFVERWTEAE